MLKFIYKPIKQQATVTRLCDLQLFDEIFKIANRYYAFIV